MAADKALTRSLLSAHTLPCPPGRLLTKDTYDPEEAAAGLGLDFPCVVKPTTAENSMGMTLVKTEAQLAPALEKALSHGTLYHFVRVLSWGSAHQRNDVECAG